MTRKSNHLKILLSLLATIGLFACAGKDVDQGDPKALYDAAEENIADSNYLEAMEQLESVQNKFPYSHLSSLARLRIADVHFLQENFIESAAAYENFRDLHPKHAKADYVLYRIGESHYNQLPSTVDRDMTTGKKAIQAYRELLTLYPDSQYTVKSRERKESAKEKLALKEQYIADFYYIRDMYDSAAKRYGKITSEYGETTIVQEAYWRWGQSLIHQSEEEEFEDKRPELIAEAKHVYRNYIRLFPRGEYVQDVGDWLDENGGR